MWIIDLSQIYQWCLQTMRVERWKNRCWKKNELTVQSMSYNPSLKFLSISQGHFTVWFISNRRGEMYFPLQAVMPQRTIRFTEWMPWKKKFSLAQKQVQSAKHVIEPLIKLPICKQRAFHHLNHRFISNRTWELL